MQKTNSIALKSLVCSVLLFFIVSNHSSRAFADTASSTDPSSSTTTQTTGPNKPTGPSADTYTYDSTTGLWVNQYYSWNPVTQQTEPLTPQTYSYNPSTGMWDTTQWVYDAASQAYVPNTVSVATPPAGAPTVGGPTPQTDDSSTSTTNPDGSSSSSNTTPTSSSTSTTTANGATTNTNTSNTNNGNYDLFYNAGISGDINSSATTGDATVNGNTTADNATSGNAADIANLINLLQSSGSLAGSGLQTFEDNITGDVNGNIDIDPTTLLNALNTQLDSALTNLQLTSLANGVINNNVTLNADSGDSGVTDNTDAGNATTGTADALANIINLIDSNISAGQSFLGVINIYGDLTGNILVPSQFLGNTIASNTQTTTDQPTLESDTGTVLNNQTANNDISATAASGSANVNDNTNAGNATTGSATTNVTLLNLTGDQVIGSNALLVFVNVLGTWVGMIVNAPGSTAAALGGGLSQDSVVPADVTNTSVTNNQAINNDVNVDANSGNATVAQNTTAGNATSGNASAGVNVVNILGSQFNLSSWFGILFINVFGTWDGNFGAIQPTIASTTQTNSPGGTSTSDNSDVLIADIIPVVTEQNNGNNNLNRTFDISNDGNTPGSSTTQEISSPNETPVKTTLPSSANSSIATAKNASYNRDIAFAGILAGVILLTAERILARRQRRNKDISTKDVN